MWWGYIIIRQAYTLKKSNQERMKSLKRTKLNIRIHNPNTEDETVRYITRIFVEVGVHKLEKAVKEAVEENKKE